MGSANSGYSCVSAGAEAASKDLAAGTAGGHIRWLDAAAGAARASILCRPAGRSEVMPLCSTGNRTMESMWCSLLLLSQRNASELAPFNHDRPPTLGSMRGTHGAQAEILVAHVQGSPVTAVHHCAPQWLAAGMASGHVGLADARCGQLVGAWRAHQTPLTAVHCAASTHQLVSASQVQHRPSSWPGRGQNTPLFVTYPACATALTLY